eukprot:TRINITY_DN4979_c0_g1_i3.p1 TRINITY_DN4979_c0_g1~~TRINITY_DN4979_c0_g1_i3.p1  ORF type:complete len:396 (+),score=113.99 TRINITY_DN4979_c0_g1_i3:296-1483(+)
MKFAERLKEAMLHDWSLFYIDYNGLKKLIKDETTKETIDVKHAEQLFFPMLELELSKASKFYAKRLHWCREYLEDLQLRAECLRLTGSWEHSDVKTAKNSESDDEARLAEEDDSDDEGSDDTGAPPSPTHVPETPVVVFEQYLYAKKTLVDYQRELRLLHEFAHLNSEGVRKIVKKFDKRVGTEHLADFLARMQAHPEHGLLWRLADSEGLQADAKAVLAGVMDLRPQGNFREGRKVFTIGCFDLFHRGHENMLRMLREFGTFVVVGVHDDESYFKLKNKKTIHKTLERVEHVKQYADMVFVIPDTNPTPWIKAMVSNQDVANEAVCYVRGEDMLEFPGREYVEANMPVYFLPRSEGVSSTLLRTIYHNSNAKESALAAHADTDETGKPIIHADK